MEKSCASGERSSFPQSYHSARPGQSLPARRWPRRRSRHPLLPWLPPRLPTFTITAEPADRMTKRPAVKSCDLQQASRVIAASRGELITINLNDCRGPEPSCGLRPSGNLRRIPSLPPLSPYGRTAVAALDIPCDRRCRERRDAAYQRQPRVSGQFANQPCKTPRRPARPARSRPASAARPGHRDIADRT